VPASLGKHGFYEAVAHTSRQAVCHCLPQGKQC